MLHVFPCHSVNDTPNSGGSDFVLARQCIQRMAALSRLILLANLKNVSLAKFRLRNALPFYLSILTHHIVVVVLMGAEKQMQRINAKTVIARMANAQATRVSLIIKKVRKSMGVKPKKTSRTPYAIIIWLRFCSLPFPASRRATNHFVPKTGYLLRRKSWQVTMGSRHNLLLFSRLCLGSVACVRTLSSRLYFNTNGGHCAFP